MQWRALDSGLQIAANALCFKGQAPAPSAEYSWNNETFGAVQTRLGRGLETETVGCFGAARGLEDQPASVRQADCDRAFDLRREGRNRAGQPIVAFEQGSRKVRLTP